VHKRGPRTSTDWEVAGRKRRPRLAHVVGGPWTVSSRLVRFREMFGRGGGVALPRAKEKRCLVDEDSDQPAFEGAFAAEAWRVAGGLEATVFDGFFGFLDTIEDAACEEVKQAAAARELQFEGLFPFIAGFAVGFAVAAASGRVELLDRFRGSGEFWGGVCHKHHVSCYN
jgi:hypothetical protein